MSIVLKDFRCKVTKKIYKAGSVYNGDRTEELQRLGYVSDDELQDPKQEPSAEWPKHTGGGYYELSNGEKVKGRDAAIAAQAELNAAGS